MLSDQVLYPPSDRSSCNPCPDPGPDPAQWPRPGRWRSASRRRHNWVAAIAVSRATLRSLVPAGGLQGRPIVGDGVERNAIDEEDIRLKRSPSASCPENLGHDPLGAVGGVVLQDREPECTGLNGDVADAGNLETLGPAACPSPSLGSSTCPSNGLP